MEQLPHICSDTSRCVIRVPLFFVGGNNLSTGYYITTEDENMSDCEANSNVRAYKLQATL